MNWVIYTLKNPRTLEVRYVGKTEVGLQTRLREHINDSVNNRQTYKQRGFFALYSIGLTPLIEAIESGDDDLWEQAECRWIAFYRARGARLWNTTKGGDGVRGLTAAQLSARAKKQKANMTPEQRAANMKRLNASLTPEQRSDAVRIQHLKRTPEQRAASIERVKSLNVLLTSEQRSVAAKNWHAKETPEQRAATAVKIKAAQTHEGRSAAAHKAWATRRAASA